MKPKFKVGDKVRVLRASTEAEHDLWRDCWMPSMNYAIGKIMTVKYIGNTWEDCLYLKYSFEEIDLNFPEFVLQKEIRTGEQLLFSFME